ncbi:MAG: endo-1,4-beta-xylanase [Dehalococcoidia bacterium]|nr:endo-1,4-beta-xylanase [Dehalococcoidia bacterium]
MNRKKVHIAVLAILVAIMALPSAGCQGSGGDLWLTLTQAWNSTREWFIVNGAEDRIEKIRKGDVFIQVVDDNGTAVRNARIYFEQHNHDFLFGSNLSPLGQNGPNAVNQDWADAYTAVFNYGVLPFYWDQYETRERNNNETLLLAMADWSKKRGIITHGQPLISANAVPAWAPPGVEDVQAAMEDRVKANTIAFCGLVDYWTVVDEPLGGQWVNNAVGNWMNSSTPAVACADALVWASSGCPKATMIINDYRTDQDYRDLLQDIVRQKGKFDGIGIQSHMHRGNWPLYQVWDICSRFEDFDVPLFFTEVTVLSGALKTGVDTTQQAEDWPSTTEGEMTQADYVEKFYTLLFSHPSVEAITWWDFSDQGAWQNAPAGLLRKDMTPKPAYDALLKLIRKDWWSFGNVYTNDNGEAVFHGFYGSYKLAVEKEGKIATSNIHLTKGLDNKIKIQLTGYIQEPPTPFHDLAWPYLVAAAVIALIVMILRWVAKIKRRI